MLPTRNPEDLTSLCVLYLIIFRNCSLVTGLCNLPEAFDDDKTTGDLFLGTSDLQ